MTQRLTIVGSISPGTSFFLSIELSSLHFSMGMPFDWSERAAAEITEVCGVE